MKRTRGFSLVELMVGLVIFTLVFMVAIRGGSHLRLLHQNDNDTSFAVQKCAQMISEIRSEASRQGADSSVSSFSNFLSNSNKGHIEIFDDGNSRSLWLSAIARRDAGNGRLANPGPQVEYPPSGNKGQAFESQINVRPIPDNDQGRMVTVRVWRRRDGKLLAESAGIVTVAEPNDPPRHWYAPISISIQGVPFVENSISGGGYMTGPLNTSDGSLARLPFSQPGGQPKVNRMAYGRDRYYFPIGNNTDNSKVYREGSYHLELMKFGCYGFPYAHYAYNWATADQFNHALRYPRELAVYRAQLAQMYSNQWQVSTKTNQDGFAASLLILLQSMVDREPEFMKPLLLLLTPEVLPLPPLRNYSDAAKDTTNLPDLRAVVHPENLEYASGAPVSLRVYTYAMNPESHSESETIADVAVLIKANIAPGALSIRRLVGDSATGYGWANTTAGTDFVAVSTVVGGVASLKIVLKNSSVRVPFHPGSSTGLPSSYRLQGLEYIPCPVGTAGTPFAFGEGVKDLASAGSYSKNTARWVITIPGGTLADGEYTVETRLGDQLITGGYDANNLFNTPIDNMAVENYSDTYFWVGRQAPFVERYQFLGDPRHMPYADVKARQGYNRYFAAVPAGDYEGFTDTAEGWSWSANSPNPAWTNSGRLNFDVPRYMQLWREALLNSNGILVTGSAWKTGRFANYLSLGGEVHTKDYNSMSISGLPWNPNSAANISVNEMTDPRRRTNSVANFTEAYQRVVAKSDNSWVSRPWLGELFPDSEQAQWHAVGNLATGPAGFYRARYSVFASTFGLTAGTEFVSQASDGAAALFFNGNPSADSTTMFLQSEGYTISGSAAPTAPEPTMTPEGRLLVKQLPFGIVEPVGTAFNLNGAPAVRPDGYDRADLVGSRTRTSLRESWLVDATNLPVMGLVRMADPANSSRLAHVVLDGTLRRLNTSYPSDTARLYAQSIWSYLRAGESDLPGPQRTQPPPTLTITSPEPKVYQNPASIPVTFTLNWTWPDGKTYTDAYPNTYASADPVVVNGYYLIMSEGNGMDYRYYPIQGGGGWQMSYTYFWPWPAKAIASPYNWNVSGLPTGDYTLVLYAFPTGSPRNPSYGFHRVRFSIQR